MTRTPPPLHIDDIVYLRKAHPCGTNRWRVLRTGADVRLQCLGCGRYVLIDRAEFNRRYRAHETAEAQEEQT